ncbi:MAG: hypothetical protein HY435_02090 [Candidatus Liptonbacteria bacterium]|nr:hypothetical protein [Candidatus Liptonbacteria bacterium]
MLAMLHSWIQRIKGWYGFLAANDVPLFGRVTLLKFFIFIFWLWVAAGALWIFLIIIAILQRRVG